MIAQPRPISHKREAELLRLLSETVQFDGPGFGDELPVIDPEDDDETDEGVSKVDNRLRDPKGGLTAAGRKHFKEKEGSNLKPGVRGPADTPEKMRRKGSFLTRFYTNPSGPMVGDNGKPTRLALSAAAWGEPVPKNMEDAKKLAAKGRRLLEQYESTKKKS